MRLQERIRLLHQLGDYMLSADPEWLDIKDRASRENGWFIPEFIDLSVSRIAKSFLREPILLEWAGQYAVPEQNPSPRRIGIIMAGNIPLVGFHDWLCVFISGHIAHVKPSSRDQVLIKHLADKLSQWNEAAAGWTHFSEMLKGCDAYIATGSNQSAGYFNYYFSRYPNIIRRNRTSVAIVTGNETSEQLSALADDVFQYFGLGCRNVTKLYVPKDYDFVPLITEFRKYNYLADHHKYKNNYDYNLALHLLNKKYYMSNDSILLVEETGLFSPISQLNYEFYTDQDLLLAELETQQDIQCIVSATRIPFGSAQQPGIRDYADGVDTLKFLLSLS